MDKKSNEITVLPPVLKELAHRGVVFAFDALNTQKTCEQIVVSGNHYLGALKGNHGRFFKALKL